jgi:3-oxoadipate enol-lactonase
VRDYQSSAALAIPATAGQADDQAACLCIACALRVRPLLPPGVRRSREASARVLRLCSQGSGPGLKGIPAGSIRPMTAVDLAHDDAGEGPVVVLIHGHPFNRSMWTPQLAALRDSFRVIAPDLRGYGDSPVTPGTVPMAQLAADVGHLLDTKGIATGALTGLSMGGLVVMELAAAQPHRWWAYGFIATTAQRVTVEEQQARLASARTMEEQGMRPVAEQMADRLFGPDPGTELTAPVMAMMLATSAAGAAAAVRGRAGRPDYQPVLESLTAPALVCTGDRDSYSTAEVTAELVTCLRDPEVVVMNGVGHLPNLERPGDFNEHLLGFLTRARPR